MKRTIGFIGCGNMGGAMIGGMISSGICPKERLLASAKTLTSADRIAKTYGITTTLDNKALAAASDVIFLAVKPNMYESVIKEIKDLLTANQIVVSIAAGITLEKLDHLFGKPVKLIRAMPNTPAMVLESMSAITPNEEITDDELDFVKTLFESFGKVSVVPESMMNAVIGVSGSSPAYVYLFIEAMADAAVADGMPRSQAYTFAAQSVLGAAKMVLETNTHPGALKDAVCSPGGTTIEAVATLEKKGFRDAVISAQRACVKKAIDMSK